MKTNMKKSLTLFIVLLCTVAQRAWADEWPAYMTDVAIISSGQQEITNTTFYGQYINMGYTIMDKDLNEGAGGDYIYFSYKTDSRETTNGFTTGATEGSDPDRGYITDFVLICSSKDDRPVPFMYGGRKYYPCKAYGTMNFMNSGGDLNKGNVEWKLFLYYTKDNFGDKRVVESVTFDNQKSNSVGCYVPEEDTWYYDLDFNKGVWFSTSIFMHINKVTKTNRPQTDPTMKSGLVYNGQQQRLINNAGTIDSGTLMFRIGNSGDFTADATAITRRNAGTYTVNYYAAANEYGDQSATHSQEVTIAKSPNDGATLSCGTCLESSSPSPSVANNLSTGLITYLYSTSQDGDYSQALPSHYGLWWVKAYIAADDNCDAYTTPAVSFQVQHDYIAHNSGTSESDAYQISTPNDINLLRERVNSGTNYQNKFFKLANDITFDGTENNFTPIGTKTHSFSGTFDGCGYTVSGIRFSSTETTQYAGFFGYLNTGGTVKNVVLSNCTFTLSQGDALGGIVGMNHGAILNCCANSNVNIYAGSDNNSINYGGIVGTNNTGGTVIGCISSAKVSKQGYADDNMAFGGIAGHNLAATMKDCLYTGNNVNASAGKGGAISGKSNGTFINNYYTSTNIGGVAGNDMTGVHKALAINAASGVTFSPTGAATTYDVSNITVYAGNKGVSHDGRYYAGTTDEVTFTINCTVTWGILTGFNDGLGHELADNGDGTYTLTIYDQAPTITPIVSPFVTSETTEMTNGTYWLNSDVTINSRITITGDVTLILQDGYTLTASKGIELTAGNKLTINGETNNSGTLICQAEDEKSGIGAYNLGDLIINGGTITATGGNKGAGLGGSNNSSADGSITINGGIITATGGEYAAGIGGGCGHDWAGAYGRCGVITINGGQVTARGGKSAAGIGAGDDNEDNANNTIKLGWTNATDFIDSNGYNSHNISFAEGKYFILEDEPTLATADNIGGHKIVPLMEPNDLYYGTIDGLKEVYCYQGTPIVLSYSVTSALGTPLTEDTDYTTELRKNNALVGKVDGQYQLSEYGSYTLTVRGKAGSGYSGYQIVSFSLNSPYVVTSTTTEMNDFVYLVVGNVTVEDRIFVTGDVTLMLTEGSTLTASQGIGVDSPHSLTIEGPGTLNAVGYNYCAGIGGTRSTAQNSATNGRITINGGTITATGGMYAAGIGGSQNYGFNENSVITINGGIITATAGLNGTGIGGGYSKSSAQPSGTCAIIINGGQVTARMSSNYEGRKRDFHGIGQTSSSSHATTCTLTLNFTDENDFLDVDTYDLTTFSIQGKAVTDGTNIYTHNTPSATLKALVDKKLQPFPYFVIVNNVNNSPDITAAAGETCNVYLDDRTIYIDGNWNTLCLPFDVTTLEGSNLDGFTVKELDTEAGSYAHQTGFDATTGTLYLNFKDATSIEAGKPYLVKKQGPTSVNYTADAGSAAINEGEGYRELIDGDQNSKWCTKTPTSEGIYYCQFHSQQLFHVTGYTLITGWDTQTYPDRNPKAWTLKAKDKNGNWIILDSRDATVNSDDLLATESNSPKDYTLAPEKQGFYQNFRFEVSKGGDDKQIMQLGELTLIGNAATELVEPKFYNVTLVADAPTPVTSDDGTLSFVGNYDPVAFEGEDKSILYLSADNTLYYPTGEMTINACRAYFKLFGIEAEDVSETKMFFDVDSEDGIIDIEHGTWNIRLARGTTSAVKESANRRRE